VPGVSVSVADVPAVYVAVHVPVVIPFAPVQLILPVFAVSTSEPFPVMLTLSVSTTAVNTGVTVWFWLIVT
jgi:hypothetical protein